MNDVKFNKLLVPIDGSPNSMRAVDYAIDIAQKYNSELNVLYVLFSQIGFAYSVETVGGLVTPSSINELMNDAKKEANEWFNKIIEKCNGMKVTIKTEVVVTAISIVEAILNYAEDKNIDLIIIGSRGRSGFKKLILGSIASGVMTYSDCAVMIIK